MACCRLVLVVGMVAGATGCARQGFTAASPRLFVWQSYCSNNSGSFHLVARFGSPQLAGEVAAELRAFFEAHANEDSRTNLSLAMIELAIKHDFEWYDDDLSWAGDWDDDDRLRVDVIEDVEAGRLFAVNNDGELLISADRGRSWRARETGVRDPLRTLCLAHGGCLIVAGNYGAAVCLRDV